VRRPRWPAKCRWPLAKVDFAKFGQVEDKPLTRIQKIAGRMIAIGRDSACDQLRGWRIYDLDIRVALNKDRTQGDAARFPEGLRVALQKSPNSTAPGGRPPGREEVLENRLRRRHAPGLVSRGEERRQEGVLEIARIRRIGRKRGKESSRRSICRAALSISSLGTAGPYFHADHQCA